MKKRFVAFTVVATLLVSQASHACRANLSAASRIHLASASIVVLAEVEQAAYDGTRQDDWHPWRGRAVAKQVLRGETSVQQFEFGRTGSTTACDDGLSPPASGAAWVLYLKEQDGKPQVLLAYPLAIARDADPTLSLRLGGRSDVR
jgi:hypothetical protein